MHPFLGLWESLIESVTDYFPGQSGAPRLNLPASSSSLNIHDGDNGDDDADSAVAMATESEWGGESSAFSSNGEDPMEGLLATQARAKEAQASGVALLEDILRLIAVGENIRHEATTTVNEEERVASKRGSTCSVSSLFARLRRKFRHLGHDFNHVMTPLLSPS